MDNEKDKVDIEQEYEQFQNRIIDGWKAAVVSLLIFIASCAVVFSLVFTFKPTETQPEIAELTMRVEAVEEKSAQNEAVISDIVDFINTAIERGQTTE